MLQINNHLFIFIKIFYSAFQRKIIEKNFKFYFKRNLDEILNIGKLIYSLFFIHYNPIQFNKTS
jgi:hypothetical protein